VISKTAFEMSWYSARLTTTLLTVVIIGHF